MIKGLQEERERGKGKEGSTRLVDNEGLEAMVERALERRRNEILGRVEELEASLAATAHNREDNKPFVVEEVGYTFPPTGEGGTRRFHLHFAFCTVIDNNDVGAIAIPVAVHSRYGTGLSVSEATSLR